jgi:hypothetical protein
MPSTASKRSKVCITLCDAKEKQLKTINAFSIQEITPIFFESKSIVKYKDGELITEEPPSIIFRELGRIRDELRNN